MAALADRFNLQRFLDAQEPVYAQVLSELSVGAKRTHWMWFIFPQIRGLGSSPTAVHFAISSLQEATAYLDHPVLGARLRECTGLVNEVSHRSARQIFPYPDDLKFHSSITLFSQAASDGDPFTTALNKFFAGAPDSATLDRIS